MKLSPFPWTSVSDDEHIAKLRRSITLWDRWRFWLILFHVGLLIAAIWVFSKAIPLLIELAQPANAPFALLGFITGTIVGLAFGWIFHGIIHGLLFAVGGFRSQRLLLKHYDALNSPPCEADQPPETDIEFKDLQQRISPW